MTSYFVILVLLVSVSAYPEPPVGYKYLVPMTANSLSDIHGISTGTVNPHHSGPAVSTAGAYRAHKTSSFSGISFDVNSNGFSPQWPSGLSGFANEASSLARGSTGSNIAGPKQVYKHVYVHTAPEESDEYQPQKKIPVHPAQTHYKIIFIKAPNPPIRTAPIIPVQPRNEEKTLVYVLSKKPEEQPDIAIPTPFPTQPSKPEVYFIKYDTRKKAVFSSGAVKIGGIASESGINNIGFSASGGIVSGNYNLANTGFNSGGGSAHSYNQVSIGSFGAPSSQKYGSPRYQYK